MDISVTIVLAVALIIVIIIAVTLARLVRLSMTGPEERTGPASDNIDRDAEVDRLLSEFEGQRLRNQSNHPEE